MVWRLACGSPLTNHPDQLQFELSGSLGVNVLAVFNQTRSARPARPCAGRVLQLCRSVAILRHSGIFEISYLLQPVSRCLLRARSLFAYRLRSRVNWGTALSCQGDCESMKRVATA